MFMVSIILTSNAISFPLLSLKIDNFCSKKYQLLFMATPNFEWLFNNLHVWTYHCTLEQQAGFS